ncbi:uncharacterized protein LOC120081023 [Benincasa hispida]|uniref:uncharacterized protein LOC120081023 n=1 Tax=Benincasa hispida TaxID=102211 RepID=UPI0018FFA30C|nr:uncharacterized protein LOC120081023 [Benincasa hispida]
MGKNKQKNAVDLKRFKDVQSLEYYNSLDWDSIIWERTLDALKITLNDKSSLYKTRVKSNKNYVVKYSLRGFPKAFQIKVKEGTVMSNAKREFRDTPFESGSRSTSEGGSPESESDGDDLHRDANDEVIRVEGEDDPEHSEHEDAEYGRVEGRTYTRSDDMMRDVREEDELNQVDVFHADSGTEPPVDEECPEYAARRREGANADESTYSYLWSIDSALSRLDGHISGLDSHVFSMEENMTDMKGQLSTILSLLQSMHKGSTVNEEMTRSPIPSREPDTTVTASDTPIPILPLQPDTTPSPTPNPLYSPKPSLP